MAMIQFYRKYIIILVDMQVCLFGYGCYGLSSMVIIITIMLQRITFYYKEKYIESTQKNETIKVVKLKRIYRICRFGSVMCGVSIITLVIVAVL